MSDVIDTRTPTTHGDSRNNSLRASLDKPLPPIRSPRSGTRLSTTQYVSPDDTITAARTPEQAQKFRLSSMMDLFSKPRFEKLRGYAESSQSLPRSYSPPPARSRVGTRPPTPTDDPSMRSSARQPAPRPAKPSVTVSSSISDSNWPPLHKVYVQSTKVILAETSGAEVPKVLRRPSPAYQTRGHGPSAFSTRASSPIGAELPCRIFALTTAGCLLQYSERGPRDRLPERILQLTKESFAVASDLIPGRPYTLQVAQHANAHGTASSPSTSLFTKLGLRGSASRRLSPSMLIVLENARDLEDWLRAVRKEIQMFGGAMDFSKALEMRRRQAYVTRADSLDPTKGVAHRASPHKRDSPTSNHDNHSRDSSCPSRTDPVLHHRHKTSNPTPTTNTVNHIARDNAEGHSGHGIDEPKRSNTSSTILSSKGRSSMSFRSSTQLSEATAPTSIGSSPCDSPLPLPLPAHQPAFPKETASESKVFAVGRAPPVNTHSPRPAQQFLPKTHLTNGAPISPRVRSVASHSELSSARTSKPSPEISRTPAAAAASRRKSLPKSYQVAPPVSLRAPSSFTNLKSTMPPTIQEHATPEPSYDTPDMSPPPSVSAAKAKEHNIYRYSNQVPASTNRVSSIPATTHIGLDHIPRLRSGHQTADDEITLPDRSSVQPANPKPVDSPLSTPKQIGTEAHLSLKPSKLSLFPTAAPTSPSQVVRAKAVAGRFPIKISSQETRALRRPASLQVQPNRAPFAPSARSISIGTNGAPVNGAYSTPALHSEFQKPTLQTSRSASDLSVLPTRNRFSDQPAQHQRHLYRDGTPIHALNPEPVEMTALPTPPQMSATHTIPEASPPTTPTETTHLTPLQRIPSNSSDLAPTATLNGPVTLPALNFGMPVEGLGPPPPPPAAPLPQVPATTSSPATTVKSSPEQRSRYRSESLSQSEYYSVKSRAGSSRANSSRGGDSRTPSPPEVEGLGIRLPMFFR